MAIVFERQYDVGEGVTFDANTGILSGQDDPTVVNISSGSVPIPPSTVYIRHGTDREIYVKYGTGNLEWRNVYPHGTVDIGQVVLVSDQKPLTDEFLIMDGSVYDNADYPDLALLMPGVQGWGIGGNIEGGTPTLAGVGNVTKFNPDNTFLAVGHNVGPRLRILNVGTWTNVVGIPSYTNDINGLSFRPNGLQLAIVFQNWPWLNILNVPAWTTVGGTPSPNGPVRKVEYSPNGNFFAVAQNNWPRVTVYNSDTFATAAGFPVPGSAGDAEDITWSQDNSYLAIAHQGSPYLTVRSVLGGWSTVVTPTISGIGRGVAFSPNGSLLAVAHDAAPFLTVINTSTWQVVPGTPVLAGNGRSVEFTPDGEFLAVGHIGGDSLSVYRVSDWSKINSIPTVPGTGNYVSFSPDDNYLAVSHATSPFLTVVSAASSSATQFFVPPVSSPVNGFEYRIRAK